MWGVTFVLIVLEKFKLCKETNLLLLLPALSSVGPAVSLRRGTCVLSQGEVFLMASDGLKLVSLCSFTLFFYN